MATAMVDASLLPCRFEQHLEQEHRALEQQRRRLFNEVAEEKERLGQQATRCSRGRAALLTVTPACPAPLTLTDSCSPALAGLQAAGRAGGTEAAPGGEQCDADSNPARRV